MILPFSSTFPADKPGIAGKPTRFVEKIVSGLAGRDCPYLDSYHLESAKVLGYISPDEFAEAVVYAEPKIHTLRRNTKGHYKAGKKLHPVINLRRPNQYQFAPDFKCVSTQRVEIKWLSITQNPIKLEPLVWLDGYSFYDKSIGYDRGLETLAINDGFESLEDFFAYFNEDWEGDLLHFSDLRY